MYKLRTGSHKPMPIKRCEKNETDAPAQGNSQNLRGKYIFFSIFLDFLFHVILVLYLIKNGGGRIRF